MNITENVENKESFKSLLKSPFSPPPTRYSLYLRYRFLPVFFPWTCKWGTHVPTCFIGLLWHVINSPRPEFQSRPREGLRNGKTQVREEVQLGHPEFAPRQGLVSSSFTHADTMTSYVTGFHSRNHTRLWCLGAGEGLRTRPAQMPRVECPSVVFPTRIATLFFFFRIAVTRERTGTS